jgi:hypothetical protein
VYIRGKWEGVMGCIYSIVYFSVKVDGCGRVYDRQMRF